MKSLDGFDERLALMLLYRTLGRPLLNEVYMAHRAASTGRGMYYCYRVKPRRAVEWGGGLRYSNDEWHAPSSEKLSMRNKPRADLQQA